MLHIFWEFQVKPDKIAEFERRYGSHGDWAQLFRRAKGFQHTTLGRSTHAPGHYLVTDVWDDAEAFAQFKKDFREAYVQLDKLCESLTLEEKHIGDFEPL
jgi:heme-degrading monooxygenase HmoA